MYMNVHREDSTISDVNTVIYDSKLLRTTCILCISFLSNKTVIGDKKKPNVASVINNLSFRSSFFMKLAMQTQRLAYVANAIFALCDCV